MRLIDADAIDYDEYWNRNGEGFTIDVCQKAQRIIDEQPTITSAEAVPFDVQLQSTREVIERFAENRVKVVRCKNCKYGEERIEDYRCLKLDEDWDIRFEPTHFCSFGERR